MGGSHGHWSTVLPCRRSRTKRPPRQHNRTPTQVLSSATMVAVRVPSSRQPRISVLYLAVYHRQVSVFRGTIERREGPDLADGLSAYKRTAHNRQTRPGRPCIISLPRPRCRSSVFPPCWAVVGGAFRVDALLGKLVAVPLRVQDSRVSGSLPV